MADLSQMSPAFNDLAGMYQGEMQGLKEQQDQAAIANTQANTANTQALTQGHVLSNELASRLQDTNVAAAQNKQQFDQAIQQHQLFSLAGDQFGKMGTMLDNVPAPARHAALYDMAKQAGVNVDDNPFLKNLADVPPDQLPQKLKDFGDKFYQSSDAARAAAAKYANENAIETMRAGAQITGHQISGEAQKYSADARERAQMYAADQRRAAAQLAAQTKQSLANIDQQVASLTMRIGTPQEQPNDRERLKFLADQQSQLKNLQAMTNRALIFGQDSGLPNAGGNGLPASPTLNVPQGGAQSSAPPSNQDFAAVAQQQGQQYEPDKYEYRINPQTGRLDRRPKR